MLLEPLKHEFEKSFLRTFIHIVINYKQLSIKIKNESVPIIFLTLHWSVSQGRHAQC